MRIHHLNCGTMRPPFGPLLGRKAQGRSHRELICHCLLVERDDGLVLIDSGLGLHDVRTPEQTLRRDFRAMVRPLLDEAETAHAQVIALGYDPRDVRHIVLTHLDVDHAGGLRDFPEAEVHVMADEWRAATERASGLEKRRYVPAQWSHAPTLHTYEPTEGDDWNGFACVRDLAGLGADLLMIPVPGHTRGHAAVAVRGDDGWLLHAGDAYFHHDEMAERPRCPAGLRLFQRVVQIDKRQRLDNRDRLRELALGHADDVTVFCAHDAVELDRFAAPDVSPPE